MHARKAFACTSESAKARAEAERVSVSMLVLAFRAGAAFGDFASCVSQLRAPPGCALLPWRRGSVAPPVSETWGLGDRH